MARSSDETVEVSANDERRMCGLAGDDDEDDLREDAAELFGRRVEDPIEAMIVPCLGCRAQWHGTARLSHDSVVPGPLSRHGGTIRHGTATLLCRVVPCLPVSCLAVSVPVPVPCRAVRPVWPCIVRPDRPTRQRTKLVFFFFL